MPDTACPATLEGGLVGIRPIMLAAPVLALFAAATSAEAPPVTPVVLVPIATVDVDPCPSGRFTQRTHFHYASRVYRTRLKVSRGARRHMKRMRDCALSVKAARNMRHLERLEARVRRERKEAEAIALAIPAQLQSIAACESGGDPTAVSASGTYRGKYQFDFATWREVGGTGDPAAAPEAVQDELAATLYRKSGPGRWPVCSVSP